MADDLFDKVAKDAALAAARTAFELGVAAGREQGFIAGMAAGRALGFVEGVNSLKAAISDGTRHGSPQCGRALESLKRLDAIREDDEDCFVTVFSDELDE